MASDLNTRLAAILERNPALRPQQSGFYSLFYGEHASQGNVRIGWHEAGPPDEDGTRSTYATDDDHAHALIFRAMVDSMPGNTILIPPQAPGRYWTVHCDIEHDGQGATALEALISFYEGKDTP